MQRRTPNSGGIPPRRLSADLRPQDRADIGEFVDWLVARGRTQSTRDTYLQAAESLALHAQVKGFPALAEIRPDGIDDYFVELRRRGNRPGTIRNRYAGICQFFRWAELAEVRADDPTMRIKAPRYPETVQPDYAQHEVASVLATIANRTAFDLRDRAIVSLLYDSGVRASELCGIAVGDVDGEARRILIRAAKAGKERVVAYSHECAVALNRYLRKRGGRDALDARAPLFVDKRGAPLTRNALRLLLARRFRCAQVEFRGVHAFRRAWGQAFLDAGGDPMNLKQLAGWESLTMLQRYVKRSATERALRSADEFSPLARLVRERASGRG